MNPNLFVLFIALALVSNIIWRYYDINKTNQIIIDKFNDDFMDGLLIGLDKNGNNQTNPVIINNEPIQQIKKIYIDPQVSFVQVMLTQDSFTYKPYKQVRIDDRYVALNYCIISFVFINFMTLLINEYLRMCEKYFILMITFIIISNLQFVFSCIMMTNEIIKYQNLNHLLQFYCNNYIDLIILYCSLSIILFGSFIYTLKSFFKNMYKN